MGDQRGAGYFDKRHFFLCNGETRSWEQSWYTEPFLSQRASFDRAASDGSVQPPASILGTIQGCTAEGSAQSMTPLLLHTPETPTAVVTPKLSTIPPVASTAPNGVVVTVSTFSVMTTTLSAISVSTSPWATSSVVPTIPAAVLSPVISTCAGQWDWQARGAVASLVIGVFSGLLVWLLWLLVKRKLPELYSPRRWFIEESRRPSTPNTLTSFLLPFLHLPSLSPPAGQPLTESQITLHIYLALLKLAVIPSVLGLGVALPLMIANVPCLSRTSPANERGGRLGSLNDLSLLRLLNALNPSPDSASGDAVIAKVALSSSNVTLKRALLSTIAPAISSARIRLILLLVIIGLISFLSAFLVIFRTYTAFAAYSNKFDKDICGGQQMVYVDGRGAFEGKSEEAVRKIFRKFGFMKRVGVHAEAQEKEHTEARAIEVVEVFALAKTSRLTPLVKERAKVLDALEVAETRYIQSFTMSTPQLLEVMPNDSPRVRKSRQSIIDARGDPTRSAPTDYVAPLSFYKLKELPDLPTSRISTPVAENPDAETSESGAEACPNFSHGVEAREIGSRFVESNRDSVIHGGKLAIGQRVKIAEDGVVMPDDSSPLNDVGTSYPQNAAHRVRHERRYLAGETKVTKTAVVDIDPSGISASERTVPDALLAPDKPQSQCPTRTESYVLIPTATANALRESGLRPQSTVSPLALSQYYNSIGGYRAKFKALNEEILRVQQEILEAMAEGREIIGWIFVGREVRQLPGAQELLGRTEEDIDWERIQTGSSQPGQQWGIWIKITLVASFFAVLLIPFVGLALSSAPGFANHLRFLNPLAQGDGFGPGIAETVAPALAITLLLLGTVSCVVGCTNRAPIISKTLRMQFAFRGVAGTLVAVFVIWVVVVSALLFAVDAFIERTQAARHVGDGAVNISWIVFCLLLNIAIIIPGLTIIQPHSVWRHLRRRRDIITPRQRFRLIYPPTFQLTMAFSASILALFYGLMFIVIFPLLALPILILLLLSFMATRYLATNVWCEVAGGPTSAASAMGIIRTLAWGLCLQPVLFGLVLLSRREWAIGGTSLGLGAVIVMLCEGFMASKRPRRKSTSRSADTLSDLRSAMQHRPPTSSGSTVPSSNLDSNATSTAARSRRVSNVSTILEMINSLLPSVSRLPVGPLPLASERIDDLSSTERAARALPNVSTPHHLPSFAFADSPKETVGMLYPPELLAPVPVIWLPDDKSGVGRLEAADLAKYHYLSASVGASDPTW